MCFYPSLYLADPMTDVGVLHLRLLRIIDVLSLFESLISYTSDSLWCTNLSWNFSFLGDCIVTAQPAQSGPFGTAQALPRPLAEDPLNVTSSAVRSTEFPVVRDLWSRLIATTVILNHPPPLLSYQAWLLIIPKHSVARFGLRSVSCPCDHLNCKIWQRRCSLWNDG